VWGLAIALLVIVSVDRLSVAPWGNPRGELLSPEVQGQVCVGQKFTAPFPGLYRIDVMLERASARHDHLVTVHLKADPTATADLWTSSFRTSDLQEGVPYSIEFGPMRDSKGRTYYFCLESPDSVPGDAIAVRYSPDSVLENAGAYLNDQPVAGNLTFYTYYTLRTRDKVDLLLTRMAEGRPYWFGTKGFYVGLAATYILLVAVFLWQVAQAVLEKEP
jgi:hypothetical protein